MKTIFATAAITAALAFGAQAFAEPPHHDEAGHHDMGEHHADHAEHNAHEGHDHGPDEACDPSEHARLQAMVDDTQAEAVPANLSSAGQAEVITAHVKGLVCDFCAQAVTKVFKKKAAVEDVSVDLDKGVITVDVRQGMALDDDTLKKMIRDAGYSLTSIERNLS